jgi:hypothetical protein
MNILPAATAVTALLLGLLGELRYRRLPELRVTRIGGPLPALSVIVPARNEAANLPRLLTTLHASSYPGPCEVIVVDDGSDDATGSLAAEHGARVVRVDKLPVGWMGKPHACHRGASVARGEWLLFADADTVHHAGAAAESVAWAIANNVDGVSLFPQHERGAPADRLVLAVAFAGYFAGLMRTAGLLNGQFILLRRAVYEQSGGFAAVRNEPLEDLALGHRLRTLGYHVPVARGERLVQVRMYTDLRQTWRGFTRLAVLSLRWSGPGALLTALFTIASAVPLGALLSTAPPPRTLRRAGFLWLMACAGIVPWAWRLRVVPWVLLAPLGAAFVQGAAVWGITTRLLGLPLRWKGRPF